MYLVSALKEKKNAILDQLSDEKIAMLPELHARIAVLKNLQYIDENDMVTLKGRCCCLVGAVGTIDCRFEVGTNCY